MFQRMRSYTFALLVVGLPVSMAGTSFAQPANPPKVSATEMARKLVEQLGDEQFAIREQATDQLLRIGLPAQAALSEGSRHVDREVRYRCERILLQIRQLDFDQRLEQFLRGVGTSTGSDLPGWDVFRKGYGDTLDTRKLFVDMQRAEPELLANFERGERVVTESLLNRVQELINNQQRQMTEMPPGSFAAVMLAAVQFAPTTGTNLPSQVYSLCQQGTVRTTITNGPHKELVRKLLGQWIQKTEDSTNYYTLLISLQYDFKEGLEPAVRVLRDPKSREYARQYAIPVVLRFGDQAHWPLLEAILTDERSVGTWQIQNVNINAQVRDVALAALVFATKQEPKDYGFERLQTNPTYVFMPITAGFETADARNRALQKWREYRERETKKSDN